MGMLCGLVLRTGRSVILLSGRFIVSDQRFRTGKFTKRNSAEFICIVSSVVSSYIS